MPQWQPSPPPPSRRPDQAPPAPQPQRPPAPSVRPEWPGSQSPLPTQAPAAPAAAAGEQLPTWAPAAEPPVPPAAEPYQPAAAPEPDAEFESPGRPSGPAVRPARFAASPSRSLAGAAPPRATIPSAEAKEDEYRRHLERATAAGLVRRVPKASLPKDTGGGAKRTPKTGGDQPVAERLPDEVRSLLSSYRSGVQRGRADGPNTDQRTTTPQEQP